MPSFFGTRFSAPRVKSSSQQIKARAAQLTADLPAKREAYVTASAAYADESALDPQQRHADISLDELKAASDSALAAVTDVENQLRILRDQLPAVEAREEADRLAAEEREAAKDRAEKQSQLNAWTFKAHKEALDLSAKLENLRKSKARLTETLRAIVSLADVGLNVEYGLPALINAEEKAIAEDTTHWESGKPVRPLILRFEKIKATTRNILEEKHQADLEWAARPYEPRPQWSGKQDLGMTQKTGRDGPMAAEPSGFPTPEQRNRAAYSPSDFSWPLPSPKSPAVDTTTVEDVSFATVQAAKDAGSDPHWQQTSLHRRPPELDGVAATLPAEVEPAEFEDPAYLRELRRDVIKEGV